MAESKRIGILGSGDVAKTLGQGLAARGYDVKLGTRDPKKLEGWTKEVRGTVSVGTFAEAAAHGPLVIVSTHGEATEAALELAGPKNFVGKVVLDTTNPLDFSHGMPPGLLFGLTDSLGERVQRKLAGAKVVKCFNTVGSPKMVDPKFASGPARMWVCGNDAGAKRTAEGIVRELGWAGVVDVGGIDAARWLEAMVPLWVRVGQTMNTWGHVLQVVT